MSALPQANGVLEASTSTGASSKRSARLDIPLRTFDNSVSTNKQLAAKVMAFHISDLNARKLPAATYMLRTQGLIHL